MGWRQSKNLYRLLQVDPAAEPGLIRQAFRYLTMKYHPNNPETGDKGTFDKIKEAYRTLRNPKTRAIYDESLNGPQAVLKMFADENDEILTEEGRSSFSQSQELPTVPVGYTIRVFSQLNHNYASRFARLTVGPGGVYFSCDGSVWFVDSTGQPREYARVRGKSTVCGIRFDESGVLFAGTIDGTVYKIDPNKSGRILAQLNGIGTGGGIFLSDVAIDPSANVYVSNFPSNTGGIFKISRFGDSEVLVGGPGHGTQGLFWDRDGFIWGLEHASGSVVKRSMDGREVSRVQVSDSDSFSTGSYDGNLTMDSAGRLYVTAGRAGTVFRINKKKKAESFLTGLLNPTGIAFDTDRRLFILESGRARLLSIELAEQKVRKNIES